MDDRDDEELRETLARGRFEPLPLEGEVIEVDTTDFATLDYDGLLTRLRAVLGERSQHAAAMPPVPRLDALDHLVLTVRDLAATRDWYTRALGMTVVTFDGGRLALNFGAQRINLHEAGREFEPKAARPTPGSADLCFLTEIPLAVFGQHLTASGVPIEVGPVGRVGASGQLRSLYVRDPDGNLIEIANRVAGESERGA